MSRGDDASWHDPYATGARTEVAIARVRAEVASLHAELVRYGLVVWTDGNVSARVPDADLFVIKPSGLAYDDLAPENMVLCDLDGAVIDGTPGSDRAPSVDTATHAYVYRNMTDVGGIVHTHSPYAVGWAARGEAIPCVLVSIAGEFGGPIPVGPLAPFGDEAIGRGIVDTLTDHRSQAVLMRGHGPFAIGATPRDAVRAAVLCEDAARAVQLARAGGELEALDDDLIDSLFARRRSAVERATDEDRARVVGARNN